MLLVFQDCNYFVSRDQWDPKQKVLVKHGLGLIRTIVDKLRQQNDCLDMFSRGAFGHLINIKFEEFPARIMHHVILRMVLATENELCFVFGGTQLRFGIKEFAMMTGLNCAPLQNPTYKASDKKRPFKKKFFAKDTKLRIENIKSVFNSTACN